MKTNTKFRLYPTQFYLEWKVFQINVVEKINPLRAEWNPTCYFLALLGAHRILHVNRIRVKTHILSLITYFWKSCRLWDKVEKQCRAGQDTDGNMGKRSACSIPKATNTHSDYVISYAFPRQQWFQERASMLRYKYIVCLVEIYFRNLFRLYGRMHNLF